MKKILIHTLFYQNYNYGGILQAYALYHKLEDMGCTCKELLYTQRIENKLKRLWYRRHRILEILKHLKYYAEEKRKAQKGNVLYQRYIDYAGGDLMCKSFEDFMKKEFQTTKLYNPISIKKFSEEFDFYITGGDQVWNPEWTDKNFFLCFGKANKKIGYSCSAGKSSFSAYDKKKILKYIKNLDVISVREKNLSEMLAEKSIAHEIVADPVYLLTKSEWEKFAFDKYHIEKNYIFTYLLGEDETRRKMVKKFAENSGMPIVTIPHIFRRYSEYDENFADIEIMDAGPREFVALIQNAAFVLTDSFHGTAFSLIMEKQFLNFSRTLDTDIRNQNTRLTSILAEYDLTNRMTNLEKLGESGVGLVKEIDYDKKREVTYKKHESALKFLQENFNQTDGI